MDDKHLLALVEGARQGDTQAFVDLCEHKAKDILYVCIKLTGNLQDGEDAAQEVFLHMQSGIQRLKNPHTFPAWLNRIISRTCVRLMESERKMQWDERGETGLAQLTEQNSEFLPAQCAENREAREAVLAALDALALRHKSVLVMYYFEQLSLKEIACALEISQNAATVRLHRARAALKKGVETRSGRQLSLPAATPLSTVPVLAKILQAEAAGLVSEQSVNRLLGLLGGASALALADLPALLAPLGGMLLCGVLVAAGVWFGSTSPSPAPARDLSAIVPQQSYAAPTGAGEGDVLLDFDAHSTADGSPAPPSSTPASAESDRGATQQAGTPVHITGRVVLLGGDGREADGAKLSAVSLTLVLPGGETLCPTVQAGGEFSLELDASHAGTQLTLWVSTPDESGLEVNAELVFTASRGAQLRVPVRDVQPPSGALIFCDGGGEELHAAVRPHEARLVWWDNTGLAHAEWQILRADGAQVLQAGEGAHVPLDTLAADCGRGRYVLVYTLEDFAGNRTLLRREFAV